MSKFAVERESTGVVGFPRGCQIQLHVWQRLRPPANKNSKINLNGEPKKEIGANQLWKKNLWIVGDFFHCEFVPFFRRLFTVEMKDSLKSYQITFSCISTIFDLKGFRHACLSLSLYNNLIIAVALVVKSLGSIFFFLWWENFFFLELPLLFRLSIAILRR